jgi:hypothetical protein
MSMGVISGEWSARVKAAREGGGPLGGARQIPAPDADAGGVSQDAVVNEGGVAVTRRIMYALLSPDALLRHSEGHMHIAGEEQRKLTVASSTMAITEATVACRKRIFTHCCRTCCELLHASPAPPCSAQRERAR